MKRNSANNDSGNIGRNILVTSALPYSNGDLHLGHLIEYLQTDFWVRFQKMQGNRCFYFCADDTHGTPIMISAQKEKIDPQTMVERNQKKHLQDFRRFGIDFTHYGSTNCDENRELSHFFFEKIKDKGHITLRDVKQSYCEKDAMFLPDRFVKGQCPFCKTDDQYGDCCENCGRTYTPEEIINPKCVRCGSTPVFKKSEHIFFELNHFKDFLRKWIHTCLDQELVNKLLEWFNEDLRAWDISRDEPYFGFEIPGYPGKYFYVWVDAPIGYIACSQQWAKKNNFDYRDFWKGQQFEIHHFIGKDIVYFHSLFWPAMLHCAEFNLPKKIHVHGFLTFNGEKLSKSRGNIIGVSNFADLIEPEYLRYYYACRINNSINDIDFNTDDFMLKINSELVGKIINLFSRSVQMLHKKNESELTTMSEEGLAILKSWQAKKIIITSLFEKCEFSKVMLEIREMAETANRYLDQKAPWKIWNDQRQLAASTLCDVVNFARVIAIYLTPIMPKMCEKIAKIFNEKPYSFESTKTTVEKITLGPYSYLGQPVEKKQLEDLLAS